MAGPTEPGDMSAAELFREHAPFVARFLFRLGVPADAIDDAVQEVFLVVHQRGGYRKGPAKPTSYLALIAANAASVQRRRARAQASRLDGAQPDELDAPGASPEHRLETHDALRRLQAALDKLDPDLRVTLLLADGENETCASIAEAMGVPVGTVYWRLHEARKKFQRALAAVDAALNRSRAPRLPAGDGGKVPAPVFSRSARMYSVLFGLVLPTWRGSRAQALVRETAQEMPIAFDVEAGLKRHVDAVARLPATAPGNVSPSAHSGGLGSGALKAALFAGAGGAALLAVLQLAPRANTLTSRATSRAVAAANPAGAPGRAELATSAPLGSAPMPLKPVALNAGEDAVKSTEPARKLAGAPPTPSTRARARTATGTHPILGGGARAANRVEPVVQQSAAAEADAPAEQALPEAPQNQPPKSGALEVDEVIEAQALGRAEGLLRSDPAQALAIVRKVALQSRSDYLAEERRYIEVMALHALARTRDAQHAADAFLTTYPRSMFAERVRRVREGT